MHTCDIETQLEAAGLRKTKDRHAILKLFQENRTWTAAQIHEKHRISDLSTIYRNLQKLVELGLLTEVHAHSGETHYERTRTDHHDHLVCDTCDVTECVPCPVKNLQPHILELTGHCASCGSYDA